MTDGSRRLVAEEATLRRMAALWEQAIDRQRQARKLYAAAKRDRLPRRVRVEAYDQKLKAERHAAERARLTARYLNYLFTWRWVRG